MSSTVQRIRANRRVVEQNCPTCHSGFLIAEEVYQCSSCGGYHHVACWDSLGTCSQPSPAPATSPAPQLAPSPPVEPHIWMHETAAKPMMSDADLAATYTSWPNETLEEALTTHRTSYSATAVSMMENGWKRRSQPALRRCSSCETVNKRAAESCVQCGTALQGPAPALAAAPAPTFSVNNFQPYAADATLQRDERRCPNCTLIIKSEAAKCRHCGRVFDSRYNVQEQRGYYYDPGCSIVEDEIRSDAKAALIMSLIGLLCVGLILEPIAIWKSSRALNRLGEARRQYPYVDVGSARGQAIAALVIGIIACVIYVIGILGKISTIGR